MVRANGGVGADLGSAVLHSGGVTEDIVYSGAVGVLEVFSGSVVGVSAVVGVRGMEVGLGKEGSMLGVLCRGGLRGVVGILIHEACVEIPCNNAELSGICCVDGEVVVDLGADGGVVRRYVGT